MLRSHNWKLSEKQKARMGKRKSSGRANKPVKKRMEKLETAFTCPFCNHGQSVECKIYEVNGEMVGTAVCYVCREFYHTTANTLTEPIDIYSDWIDECERVNT